MALVNIHYASMTIKNIKQSEAMTVRTLLDKWITKKIETDCAHF